jgi:spore germination protein
VYALLIYVVKPGDSLWSIARRYGANYNDIIKINGLEHRKYLVRGEALLVPTTGVNYTVKPGDSIWNIASKFKVSVNSIISLNNITNPSMLYPGMVIKIPENLKGYEQIEVNAFIIPSTSEMETAIINETCPYLTYITPFSYHVQEDGTLTPLNDEVIIREAKNCGIAPLLCIDNTSDGVFSRELIGKILNSKSLQDTLINNVINILKAKGYTGVFIDFEDIAPDNRENYNNFLKEIVRRLHEQNYTVTTALPPKASDSKPGTVYEAYDYIVQGELVDFTFIMTYEWGWAGGKPMAVAPINQVLKVLDYAVTVIPRNKIIMGIPLYGYDWMLPYVPGGKYARAIGCKEAVNMAEKYGARIKYDVVAQSPFYNYVDENRLQHVVWFEDARSIEVKFNAVKRYHLKGIGYWVLGKPFPQNWVLLNTMFTIKKLG